MDCFGLELYRASERLGHQRAGEKTFDARSKKKSCATTLIGKLVHAANWFVVVCCPTIIKEMNIEDENWKISNSID